MNDNINYNIMRNYFQAVLNDMLQQDKQASERIEGILETLVTVSKSNDANDNNIIAIVDQSIELYGNEIKAIIVEHSPGSGYYVADKDELFAHPEILVIAALSLQHKSAMRAAFKNSDFENTIESISSKFNTMRKFDAL